MCTNFENHIFIWLTANEINEVVIYLRRAGMVSVIMLTVILLWLLLSKRWDKLL